MADEKRTLEMRIAELEDKLAKVHISEEEMATYNKVAAKLAGGAGGGATTGPSAAVQCLQCIPQPIISQCIHCIIRDCIRPIIRNPIYWADCIPQCAPGGGGFGGGGFGGLGG